MNQLEDFELVGNCAIYRLKGTVPVHEGLKLTIQAVETARSRLIPKLLLDFTRMEGLVIPNDAQRYFIMREIAAAAKGTVKIAFVLPTHMIQDKFGVLVGKNAGLTSDAFTNETDALAWLDEKLQ